MGSEENGGHKPKLSTTCEWTPDAVHCLLNRYGEKYAIGKGCLRNKDWEDLVESVNAVCDGQGRPKTLKQCRDKVDSLKKRYKMEKGRVSGVGMASSTWPFFSKLDQIIQSVPRSLNALAVPPQKQVRPANDMHAGRSVSPMELQLNGSINGKDEDMPTSGDPTTDSISGDSEHEGSSEKSGKEESSEATSEDEDTPSSSQESQGHDVTGDCLRKFEQFSESMRKLLADRKGRTSSNPIQAMTDAVVGFSDVYARIELAKLEIYTSMQLEIAKLDRKRKRKTKKHALSSGSLLR